MTGAASPGLLEAIAAWGSNTGKHWSAQNAAFEATNPGLGDRLVRGVNPMTSLGSALGSMHDAASEADARGMGIALLQALPLFGVVGKTIPAASVLKAQQVAPDLGAWGAKALLGGVASGIADATQAGKGDK